MAIVSFLDVTDDPVQDAPSVILASLLTESSKTFFLSRESLKGLLFISCESTFIVLLWLVRLCCPE